MYILRIEHPVPDFQKWKQVYDCDPLDRKKMGVRYSRVSRAVDNTNHVLIDLGFNTEGDARSMLAALEALWGRVEGTVMSGARTRILETVEEKSI